MEKRLPSNLTTGTTYFWWAFTLDGRGQTLNQFACACSTQIICLSWEIVNSLYKNFKKARKGWCQHCTFFCHVFGQLFLKQIASAFHIKHLKRLYDLVLWNWLVSTQFKQQQVLTLGFDHVIDVILLVCIIDFELEWGVCSSYTHRHSILSNVYLKIN